MKAANVSSMTDIRYYIKHPNGRERIAAKTDAEAQRKFKEHWTARGVTWNAGTKRELVKETRETIASEVIGSC